MKGVISIARKKSVKNNQDKLIINIPASEKSYYDKRRQIHCQYCGKFIEDEIVSQSNLYDGYGKTLPICRECLLIIFKHYREAYEEQGLSNPLKDALKRICMMFNMYYNNKFFESIKKSGEDSEIFLNTYLRTFKLNQYSGKTFDTTLQESFQKGGNLQYSLNNIEEGEKGLYVPSEETIELFGKGFKPEKYEFLQEKYDDWISNSETIDVGTREIVKQMCMKQWEIYQANLHDVETKDLTKSLQDLMKDANLTPKQNAADASLDEIPYGVWIDKLENERPVSDVDPEFEDVDKITVYLHTFFFGCMAKMIGAKNFFSKTFDKFMKKYTVEMPDYSEDTYEGSQEIFDKMFGDVDLDSGGD